MARLNSDHYRVLVAAAAASLAAQDKTIWRELLLEQLVLRPYIDVDEGLALLARLGLIVSDGEKWRVTERGWDLVNRVT